MHRLMPELENYFHYRNLDVSSFKELVRRWAPDKQQFVKNSSHVALNDIKDSIEELRFYRDNYFKI
jgi:oligoribonuclease